MFSIKVEILREIRERQRRAREREREITKGILLTQGSEMERMLENLVLKQLPKEILENFKTVVDFLVDIYKFSRENFSRSRSRIDEKRRNDEDYILLLM